MIDFSRYIVDGNVKRGLIAEDIIKSMLSREELEELLSYPTLKDSYFKHKDWERESQIKWTQGYVQFLSYAIVAEVFDEEYLRYLFEVAEYVRSRNSSVRKKVMLSVIGVLALIMFVSVISCVSCTYKKETEKTITLIEGGDSHV